jgi:hypothetical protein
MFWLDMSKSEEMELAEEIENLKEQRLFSETIRDGIQLICDLRAGRTERLFTLFPWLVAEAGQPDELLDRAIRQEIDQLRELLAQQQWAGANGSDAWPAATRITSAANSAVAAGEDDEMALEVKAVKNGASGANFLSSLLSLQQQKG